MSKQNLMNTIGKLFVEEQFRREFFNNTDQTLDNIAGLTNEEKQFLKDMKNPIRESVDRLDIHYEGEDKRS